MAQERVLRGLNEASRTYKINFTVGSLNIFLGTAAMITEAVSPTWLRLGDIGMLGLIGAAASNAGALGMYFGWHTYTNALKRLEVDAEQIKYRITTKFIGPLQVIRYNLDKPDKNETTDI